MTVCMLAGKETHHINKDAQAQVQVVLQLEGDCAWTLLL